MFGFLFKKKNIPGPKDWIEDLVENSYQYDESSIQQHYPLYDTLSLEQKNSILLMMIVFQKGFIIKDTAYGELVSSLLNLKSDMMKLRIEEVKEITLAQIQPILCTLPDKIKKIMLDDFKFIFTQVVHLTMPYRDGVEMNHKALDFMYGTFIPMGFTESEVHNPKDYMYF